MSSQNHCTSIELIEHRFSMYLSTDKNQYKPGENVFIRGIILNEFHHRPPLDYFSDESFFFRIKGPGGNVVVGGSDFSTPAHQNGVIAVNWNIPTGQVGGSYKIEIGLKQYCESLFLTGRQEEETEGEEEKTTENSLKSTPEFFPISTRSFRIQNYTPPKFKLVLEFERRGYSNGSTARAKLRVLNSDGNPLKSFQTLAVARIDGKEVMKETLMSKSGQVEMVVEFDLPNEILEGNGSLSCTVTSSGRSENVTKTIPILLRKINCEMFPEGGDLVYGVKNGCYFQSTTNYGDPADFSGCLLEISDEETMEICPIQTIHEGRGVFEFTPKKGKTYQIRVDDPCGVKTRIGLPAMKEIGVSLRILNKTMEFGRSERFNNIEVALMSPKNVDVRLLLYKKEKRVFQSDVIRLRTKEEEIVTVEFNELEFFFDGVLRLSVNLVGKKKGESLPVAERLVMFHPQDELEFEFETDKKKYLPGEKCELTILSKFKNDKSTRKSSIVTTCVTVTDDSVIQMLEKRKRPPRLYEMVYLENEVRELKDCTSYNDSGVKCDLLLGIQGWRRFVYKLLKYEESSFDLDQLFKKIADEKTDEEMYLRMLNYPNSEYMKRWEEKLEKIKAEEERERKKKERLKEEIDAARTLGQKKQDVRFADLQRKSGGGGIVSSLIGFLGIGDKLQRDMQRMEDVIFSLRFKSKRIDREAKRVDREVRNYKMKTKKVLERGNLEAARIFAEHVIRKKNEMNELYRLSARVDALSCNFASTFSKKSKLAEYTVSARKRVLGFFDRLKDIDKMNMDQLRVVLDHFETRFEDLSVISKYSSSSSTSTDEDTPDIILQQICDEHSLEIEGVQSIGLTLHQAQEEDDFENDLTARLNRLRDEFPPVGPSSSSNITTSTKSVDYSGSRPTGTKKNVNIYFSKNISYAREYTFGGKKDELHPGGSRRDVFTETVFFSPFLKSKFREVGNFHETKVSFHLNDSVTSFLVKVDAFSNDGIIGSSSDYLIRTYKPFYLSPKLPEEISSVDVLRIPCGISLNDPQSENDGDCVVQVSDSLSVFAISPSVWKGNVLNSNVHFEMKPKIVHSERAAYTSVSFEGSYGGDRLKDSVVRDIEIKPYGFPVSHNFSFDASKIQKDVLCSFSIDPETYVVGSLKTESSISLSSLGSLISASKKMIRFPCGCFEQVAATLYPMIMAKEFLLSRNLPVESVNENIENYLKKGYEKLLSYEIKSGGGFEWFGIPPANESLSAMGLSLFLDLSRVFPSVSKDMVGRTRKYLVSRMAGNTFLRGKGKYRYGHANQKTSDAYIVWCLSRSSSSLVENEIRSLENVVTELKKNIVPSSNQPQDLPSCDYITALLALSLFNLGKKEESRELCQLLLRSQSEDGSFRRSIIDTVTRSGGIDKILECTALSCLALMNFSKISTNDGDDDVNDNYFFESVEMSVSFILGNNKCGCYGSTQSTVLCLRAIVDFFAKFGEFLDDNNGRKNKVGVHVNGENVCEMEFLRYTDSPSIEIPDFSNHIKTDGRKNEIQVMSIITGKSTNKMMLPCSVSVSYKTKVPLSSDGDVALPFRFDAKIRDTRIEEGSSTDIRVQLENLKDGLPMLISVVGLPSGVRARVERLEELQKMNKMEEYDDEKEESSSSSRCFDYFELFGPRKIAFYWRGLKPSEKIDFSFDVTAEIPGKFVGETSSCFLYYDRSVVQRVHGIECEIFSRK